MRKINIKEQRFGRLVARCSTGYRISGHVVWLCFCDCGKWTFVSVDNLKRNITKSCGCFRSELMEKGLTTTHGKSKTPEFYIWNSMKQRCYNTNNKFYKYYGGRGIRVCKRWKNSFINFLKDMGERPSPELTLERINNDKGYFPSNCKWATRKEQNNNKRKYKKKV